jgi:curved DNA-binding protein CbpA
MIHQFPLDPRSVLGISPDASLEEIDRAFRAKSMKHHPDHGGDEWAFRIVSRAYEILKSAPRLRAENGATATTTGGSHGPRDERGDGQGGDRDRSDDSGPAAEGARPGVNAVPPSPAELRTVDVELIWLRFEFATPAGARLETEPTEATLSVCMALSWPRASLVERAAELPDASATLRRVIETFEHLRGQGSVLASRSRIEDGQFVGWLSYPDVVRAMLGFEAVKDALSLHGFQVKLRTRDELVPQEWRDR